MPPLALPTSKSCEKSEKWRACVSRSPCLGVSFISFFLPASQPFPKAKDSVVSQNHVTPRRIFITYRGKTVTSQRRNLAGSTLTEGSKFTSTVVTHRDITRLLEQCIEGTVGLLWSPCYKFRIARKHQTTPDGEVSSKVIFQCFPKVSKARKTKKTGNVADDGRLGRRDSSVQCVTLGWILHQKRDIGGITGRA